MSFRTRGVGLCCGTGEKTFRSCISPTLHVEKFSPRAKHSLRLLVEMTMWLFIKHIIQKISRKLPCFQPAGFGFAAYRENRVEMLLQLVRIAFKNL